MLHHDTSATQRCSTPLQDAVPAGVDLCGGELVARSVEASIDRLIAGDETAAVFKSDPGELKVRDVRLRAG